MDYIENGNIVNSVNFPAVNLGAKACACRVAIATKGVENPLKLASDLLANYKVTAISGNVRGAYGYVLANVAEAVANVPSAEGVIKIRVI